MKLETEATYCLLKNARNPHIQEVAKSCLVRNRMEPHDEYLVPFDAGMVPAEALPELAEILHSSGSKRGARALQAITQYSEGDFSKKVPSFTAFPRGLEEFLRAKTQRGWIYHRTVSGRLKPYAILSVSVETPFRSDPDAKPRCILTCESYSPDNGRHSTTAFSVERKTFWWEPSDVTRKAIPDILSAAGVFMDLDSENQEYDAILERFYGDMLPRFSEQLTQATGTYDEDDLPMGASKRVLHDLKMKEFGTPPEFCDSRVVEGEVRMPVHPMIRVFDLRDHNFSWKHVSDLEPYQYDHALRDKLVLPTSHRDLLDVLTSDLSVFSTDLIEGKSGGNMIVCKGPPGLGKTLTAEIYSELTETPIYAIHSGSMGTSPAEVEKQLRLIFKRQRRWGCLILLDEADVFVKERKDDLNQNAIVAEFLRVLEYFEGLMFMTTNRVDDIDDAIISRAAAIIEYQYPDRALARRIWNVMFENQGVKPPKNLVGELLELFPEIAPRDIKMLLRLVLRVAKNKDMGLDRELFRRIAMFRAIRISEPAEELSSADDLI